MQMPVAWSRTYARLHDERPADFSRVDHEPYVWYVKADSGCRELDIVLNDPDALLSAGAEVIKSTGTCLVARAFGYVIKRWSFPSVGAVLKECLRPSRARCAGLKALDLARAGIPTAGPLAWGERRVSGFSVCSYLVMEDLCGTIDLGKWPGDRRALLGRVGDLIGHLHRQGFAHRDLKPSNLLIDGEGRPHIIDLDGLSRRCPITHARAVSDLVRLARRMIEAAGLTPKDALQFLSRYCAARGEASRRRWWKDLRIASARYPEFGPRLGHHE